MQYTSPAKAIALATVVLAATANAALPSAPIETFWNGDTTNAPTYKRLCVGTSACGAINPSFGFPAALSGVGTAVRYITTEFEVSLQGSYNFFSASTNWDNYTFLYRSSFNPASPFVNLVTGNDDLTGINIGGTGPFMNTNNFSGFTAVLDAGTAYVMVTAGFQNPDYGQFVNSISGPAAVNILSAVPEPGTDAMLALGLAGLGLYARRVKSRRA
ncbi:MAG: hypothetical protein RIQ60_2317 [Pseudomonadota bacterium]|jgi:hypothetical protein